MADIKTFSPQAMRHVRRVVRRIVREEFQLTTPRNTGKQQLGSFVGVANGAITARSGTTPGTGSVTVKNANPTFATPTTTTGAAVADITVYNLLDSAISTSTYVHVVQDRLAGKYWATNVVEQGGGTGANDVQIRNDSGAQVDQYHLMEISGVVTTLASDKTTFLTQPPVYTGIAATVAGRHLWVVTQEDIANGATGSARISGSTPVRCELDSTGYTYTHVDISQTTRRGTLNWFGKGQVMYTEESGGERYAWINLGNFEAPMYRATANGTITAGSTGGVTLLVTGTDPTVTAGNNWMEGTHDVALNDELTVWFDVHANQWKIVAAEC